MDGSNELESDNFVNSFQAQTTIIGQRFQRLLDQSTPYVLYRWIGFGVLLFLFCTRILVTQSWYIVCYSLFIWLLNQFLAFISPKFELQNELSTVEEGGDTETESLPMHQDDEFRPFIRRLPEFKFWYSATRATVFSFFCTFFRIFDIPVFWPILLFYFIALTAITMRRQIELMIKYRYVPWDVSWRKKHLSK